MNNNDGNSFKLETVKEISKLQSAIEIGQERMAIQIESLKKDMIVLMDLVSNIKQPCDFHKKHLEYHKENESKFGLVKWIKDKPVRTALIVLIIGGQIGLSVDKIVEIIKQFIM